MYCFFLSEGSDCIKANAQSCGECIQVAEKCGWCTDTVSCLKAHAYRGTVLRLISLEAANTSVCVRSWTMAGIWFEYQCMGTFCEIVAASPEYSQSELSWVTEQNSPWRFLRFTGGWHLICCITAANWTIHYSLWYKMGKGEPQKCIIYSTSQTFGHTYSFKGFSLFLLFSTL